MKLNAFLIVSVLIIFFSLMLYGCATPSGGCPFCGYPPGVLLDGDVVHCQRCMGKYRVYLDGSVHAIQRPQQQITTPVPTNNTYKTQQDLNRTGQLFIEDLRK